MGDNPVSFVDPDGLWDGDPIYNSRGQIVGHTKTDEGINYLLDLRINISEHLTGMQIHAISAEELAEIKYRAYLAWRSNGPNPLGLARPGAPLPGAAYNQQHYSENNRSTSLAAKNISFNRNLVGKGMEGGSSLNAWDYVSNGASIASAYPTIVSTWRYNSNGGDVRWTGKNGNYYVKSQVKMNGGYVKSIKYAQNASKNLSRLGNGLTVFSVITSGVSAGIALVNGTDNTSTWVGLGIGVGGAILTTIGSPIIVTGAAVGGTVWGISQILYGDEINGLIDSNFGYR